MSNSKYFKVLYEDNHLIAVNKSAGILVQGDQSGDLPLSEMVKEYIGKKYNKPGAVFCGVIHRIDRPVSGLVLMARTSKGLSRMNEQFQKRRIRKVYFALTNKKPENEEGTLVHWITKEAQKNKAHAHESDKKGGQRAELHYTILGRNGDFYLWQIELKTGRPHQIRVQLAKINCPIKGDLKYGAPRKNHDSSIHLHSKALIFEHPVKKEKMILEAPLPKESTWSLFKDFKADLDGLD